MFLLRRAALRATSSIAVASSRPRTFTSLSPAPSAFRPRQQQWLSATQRRFNSEDANAARPSEEKTTGETVPETPSATETTSAAAEAKSTISSTAETAAQQATEAVQTTADALDAAAAAAAVGTASAQAVGGNTAQGEDRRQFVPAAEGQKTLYVGNLFYQTNEDQLRQEFSRFGNIVKTIIIRDPAGLSKGFGYVEFDNDDSAAVALVQMNQRIVDGRRLTVQHHRRGAPGDRRLRRNPPRPNDPSKTLFIGNMSFEMSDRDLNDLFREIRNVLDVRVAIDRRTGQPRGFAHADFIDETSASKAKAVLDGKEIYGRRLRVDYSTSNKTV